MTAPTPETLERIQALWINGNYDAFTIAAGVGWGGGYAGGPAAPGTVPVPSGFGKMGNLRKMGNLGKIGPSIWEKWEVWET